MASSRPLLTRLVSPAVFSSIPAFLQWCLSSALWLLATGLCALFVFAPPVVIYVIATAGLTEDQAAAQSFEVTFAFLPDETALPPVYQVSGVTFFAHGTNGPTVGGASMERGYGLPPEGVTVVFPVEVDTVALRICLADGGIEVESLDAAGAVMWQGSVQHPDECRDIRRLEGDGIAAVRLRGGAGEATIVRVGATTEHRP